MEEHGEGVHLNRIGEGVEGTEGDLVPTGEERGDRTRDGDPAERLTAGGGREAWLGHHDKDTGQGEDEFGKEGQDVGRHLLLGLRTVLRIRLKSGISPDR